MVLVATLAIKELPLVLTKLKELADGLPIRRLQYGDTTATNVSSKDLTNILETHATTKRRSKIKTSG
jgi:hypothetical protein